MLEQKMLLTSDRAENFSSQKGSEDKLSKKHLNFYKTS
jgi:hypothetical protein